MSPTRLSADEDYLFNSFEDSSNLQKVNGIDCAVEGQLIHSFHVYSTVMVKYCVS